MARLAYYAPGVYVEEIPSARQPIAGVGTNTVGFIGIVPDTVYLPVINPDYDPVLTRDLIEYVRLQSDDTGSASQEEAKRLEKLRAEFQRRVAGIDADIADLTTRQATQRQAVATTEADQRTAKAAFDVMPEGTTPEEKAAKAEKLQALRVAQKAFNAATRELAATDGTLAQKNIDKGAIGAPQAATPAEASAPATAVAEQNEVDFDFFAGATIEADSPLLQRSVLRPYYLVPFEVKADALATKLCTNFTEYANLFGSFSAFQKLGGEIRPICPGHHLLTHAVNGFFDNGGGTAFVCRVSNASQLEAALERFKSIEAVAILAAPGLPKSKDVWEALQTYCEDEAHQNVFAILDAPAVVNDSSGNLDITKLQYESPDCVLPRKSTHAAFYLPHIEVSCPAKRLQDSDPAWDVAPKYRGRTYVAPSGHMAGIYARTDEERGVHKAPANTMVRGALEVKYYISKTKQELLNPQGVNCIRLMNGDVTVWGARTIGGDRNGEFKYIPVRRFMGFLEASIDQGTQWVVFEPNDPKLWSKIILNITAFLTNVWRSGALFGLTQQEAFYVKCDAELNPPEVRDLGQVVTEIGVSIVRPAEFVIFRISQSSGQQTS